MLKFFCEISCLLEVGYLADFEIPNNLSGNDMCYKYVRFL
jgi:hypothetical protein